MMRRLGGLGLLLLILNELRGVLVVASVVTGVAHFAGHGLSPSGQHSPQVGAAPCCVVAHPRR
jgi:hypothetical protein